VRLVGALKDLRSCCVSGLIVIALNLALGGCHNLSSYLITDHKESSACHLGRLRPHQCSARLKRRPCRTECLAGPLELAVFVRQELVEVQLPPLDIAVGVRVEDGAEDRRRVSDVDVELVGGSQEVFAGDAEFACLGSEHVC
jgi:hypothetical protein